MANIFLSYSRDDAEAAGRVARSLEDAGHSVWWDQHINAGSRFSKEIDAALRASELVVVLWSRSSIESTWVQDEAAVGRDSGRLVPVVIDGAVPPLGFRQFQAISLSRRLRKLEPLHAAIALKLGEPPAVPRRRARSRDWSLPRPWQWIGGLVLLALLAGLWFLLLRPAGGPSHIVAVTAAEGGDPVRSEQLARTIAADLGRYRAGSLGALTIIGGKDPNASKADYRVEVGVSEASDTLSADVSLLSPRDSQILWTTSVEVPGGRFVDLRQQAVALLGDALGCAVDISSKDHAIGRDILGLYLNGCSAMSEANDDSSSESAISIFRQITQKAPDFAPGWANLALAEAIAQPGRTPAEWPVIGRAAREHLRRAKQLDPTVPQIYAAEAMLLRPVSTQPGRAIEVLDKGLARHPDNALLHSARAGYLGKLGRMNESIAASRRAANLNPLSPGIRDGYIMALAHGGQAGLAFRELQEAERVWPGSRVMRDVRYRLDLRYGDPRNALRLLEERGAGDLRPVPMDTSWRAFLEARIDPRPPNVERALEAFRARHRQNPGDNPAYLQALGTFGRVDEAYRAVETDEAIEGLTGGPEALFRPFMSAIRSDPRFIGLAARLGLLAYWQKSNVWPDFCSEPALPYDCRAEVAKLRKPAVRPS